MSLDYTIQKQIAVTDKRQSIAQDKASTRATSVISAKHFLVVLLATLSSLCFPQAALATKSTYHVETAASGLVHPWSMAFLPNGDALITERPGRLRLWSAKNHQTSAPLLGVPKVFTAGQAGLFAVSLSPEFATDQTIFLAYASGTINANRLTVSRAKLTNNRLDQVTEIFRCWPDKKGKAHYGGRMAWLPDGTLIISLGEGYSYREQAQVLSNHLGTIVRIHPDGTIPTDNPFVGQKEAQPEIYSYGHRNVQGLIFDPHSQQLIAHEHGPKGGDEINIIQPGKNYGWPAITYGVDYSGAIISPFTQRPGMEQPLLHWTPSIAPSGMTRYSGALFPAWKGNLLVGALAGRSVHRVVFNGKSAHDVETLFSELNERIRDVVTGPDGAVYLLTDNKKGRLLKVTPR
nr:PQQ-dependent sugar dehydrogenase [uncultured Desulfuromonas sp.]